MMSPKYSKSQTTPPDVAIELAPQYGRISSWAEADGSLMVKSLENRHRRRSPWRNRARPPRYGRPPPVRSNWHSGGPPPSPRPAPARIPSQATKTILPHNLAAKQLNPIVVSTKLPLRRKPLGRKHWDSCASPKSTRSLTRV